MGLIPFLSFPLSKPKNWHKKRLDPSKPKTYAETLSYLVIHVNSPPPITLCRCRHLKATHKITTTHTKRWSHLSLVWINPMAPVLSPIIIFLLFLDQNSWVVVPFHMTTHVPSLSLKIPNPSNPRFSTHPPTVPIPSFGHFSLSSSLLLNFSEVSTNQCRST